MYSSEFKEFHNLLHLFYTNTVILLNYDCSTALLRIIGQLLLFCTLRRFLHNVSQHTNKPSERQKTVFLSLQAEV